MMLKDLIQTAPENIEIKGICVDSRQVAEGYLFAALPGHSVDGRRFIPQAIEAGAVAILAPNGTEVPNGTILLADKNPRKRFAEIAAKFYSAQPETVAAVTGTNGKSSCVTFIRELWSLLDLQAASLGTLGVTAPGLNISGGLTTPDAAGLHARLAEITNLGVTHLAMEASSHGLDQYRMDGVKVKIAAFTNLSRDHLDYHSDMAEYFACKKRLFSDLLIDGGVAVLNADCEEYSDLTNLAKERDINVISYGKKGSTITLKQVTPSINGQHLEIEIEGKSFGINLPLAGYFQVENALCALGVVMASGYEANRIAPLLEKLPGVPGRMELIGKGVYVDYAHTPDALKTVLNALAPHCEGKLICLFGCGGDRDKGKRAQMGKVAADLADVVFITDDNPRSEDPIEIRREIMSACPEATEIGDRKIAIETAIRSMQTNDILLVAGKGHETGQIIGDKVLPFDDRALVREVINA